MPLRDSPSETTRNFRRAEQGINQMFFGKEKQQVCVKGVNSFFER